MGRKPKLTAHRRQEALARREAGEALVDIARTYNVSHSTIFELFPSRTHNSQLNLAEADVSGGAPASPFSATAAAFEPTDQKCDPCSVNAGECQ